MVKKKTPPKKMSKKGMGLLVLTIGIIGICIAITPLLTGLGVLIAIVVDIQIMKKVAIE